MFTPQTYMILAAIYIVCHLGYLIYYAFDLYQLNPFIRVQPLSSGDKLILEQNFPTYNALPKNLKEKFNKRVVWFRSHKKFTFNGEVKKQSELRLVISAAMVLMTLGLKQYKMTRSLMRIVVYPSQYYSRINKRHHLGEYNPRFKTVIFSADKIWEGFKIADDNRNLAMHELAHTLNFEMKKGNSWEARKFRVGLRKIKELFSQENFIIKIAASNYFRDYGLTNLHEFLSVALENYVETPVQFKNDFPELYIIIQHMLNFDFLLGKDVRFKTAPEN